MVEERSGIINGANTPAAPRRLEPDLVASLSKELDDEEHEMAKQLRRKRDFEARIVEKRAQLQEMRERRKQLAITVVQAEASVQRLAEETEFVKQQQREVEHDILVMKESSRLLQDAASCVSGHPANNPSSMQPNQGYQEVLAEERARQESLQESHEKIAHHRAHLQQVLEEKATLFAQQQGLFDRQRAAEQDRNLLLSLLREERIAVNDLRMHRLSLWKDRNAMEQEMTKIVQDAHFDSLRHSSARTPARWAEGQKPKLLPEVALAAAAIQESGGWSKGVRGPSLKDVPVSLQETPAPSVSPAAGASPVKTNRGSADIQKTNSPSIVFGDPLVENRQPSNWTSFGDPPGSGLVLSSVSDTRDARVASAGLDGGPIDRFSQGDRAGDLAKQAPDSLGGSGAGITEWADRMQQFKASGGSGERTLM